MSIKDGFEPTRPTQREQILQTMVAQTTINASNTTIYGLDLASMDAGEIRIAAYWLASRLEKLKIATGTL